MREYTDVLEGDDVVSRLDRRHPFANGLDDSSSFMSQDDGESTFGILAGECVRIWFQSACIFGPDGTNRTCMANASIVYLNADFMGFRRGDLDVFNRQVLASLPGYSGLSAMRDCRYERRAGMYLACDGLLSCSLALFLAEQGTAYLPLSVGRHGE